MKWTSNPRPTRAPPLRSGNGAEVSTMKGDPIQVQVTQPAGITRAGDAGRKYAAAIGFTEVECEQIALVTTELASNLVKHAGGGAIKLSSLGEKGRAGIQIESEDHGPGISDVEAAMKDGYSTARTLGAGLGAVNRLMDELEIRPRPSAGMHILCQRWLRPSKNRLAAHWLEFGAATRSCRLLPDNGDAFLLRHWEGHALAGVI